LTSLSCVSCPDPFSQLLEKGSGQDTQDRLVKLLIGELGQLPAERLPALRSRFGKAPAEAVVESAFPLENDQRQRLEKALGPVIGAKLPIRYAQNGELLAGLCITVGAWDLGANIRDELQGFAELAYRE